MPRLITFNRQRRHTGTKIIIIIFIYIVFFKRVKNRKKESYVEYENLFSHFILYILTLHVFLPCFLSSSPLLTSSRKENRLSVSHFRVYELYVYFCLQSALSLQAECMSVVVSSVIKSLKT